MGSVDPYEFRDDFLDGLLGFFGVFIYMHREICGNFDLAGITPTDSAPSLICFFA